MPVRDPSPTGHRHGDAPGPVHAGHGRVDRADCRGHGQAGRRPRGRPVSRRLLLRAGGALAVPALAGCLGGQETAPTPIALSGGVQCDVCGMVVENHPGPVGQLYFGSNTPSGHANPARFDALKQCLFPYRLEHEARGWSVRAAYVTDYSAVDYSVSGEGPYLSSHVEAGAFAPAASLRYVVGSDVKGAMGPDFVPFSVPADAEAFAAEHGGTVVAYEAIDEGLLGR